MKRMLTSVMTVCMLIGGVEGEVVTNQGAKSRIKVLDGAWFVKMDKDRDGRISEAEYIECGTACLRQKGKPIDRAQIKAKFAQFDRDGDGFITESDDGHAEQRQAERDAQDAEPLQKGSITVALNVEKQYEVKKEKEGKKNGEGHEIITATTRDICSEIPELTVTVLNTTEHSGSCSLEWYYLAKAAEGDDISLHESGCEKITVEPFSRQKQIIDVKKLEAIKTTVQRGTGAARISFSGRESAGYVVVLKCGDTVVDRKASSEEYLSEQWINRLGSTTI